MELELGQSLELHNFALGGKLQHFLKVIRLDYSYNIIYITQLGILMMVDDDDDDDGC